MDFTFWAGIILGALLCLPVSIFANLYSDQVREYLDRRKILSLNKKRSKEIAIHDRLQNLINGDPREQLLFAEQRTYLVLSTIFIFICYSAAFLILSLDKLLDVSIPMEMRVAGFAFFLVNGLALTPFLLLLLIDFRNTMRKVRRFEEYEQQIREKWGHDAI